MIGSMPHRDPAKAVAAVTHYLRDIPAWPQLPRRTYVEKMYTQYSQGFPGIVVTPDKTYVKREQDLSAPLAGFYTDYMNNDFTKYAVTTGYAAGLSKFLALDNLVVRAAKGQVTGPVTWGMTVADEGGKAVLYDETLGDVVPKFLRLKACWMEHALKKLSKDTIVFLDEPYMAAFGSVGMQLSREQVIELLNETLAGITGIKGIHCCGNTDWSIILKTSVDIVSFDAYEYAGSLALYAEDAKKLYARGGAVAWGIVPTDAAVIEKESVPGLRDRLEEAMAPFTRDGVPFRQVTEQALLTPACGIPMKQVVEQGILTPSCGLGSTASEAAAERALELLVELSKAMRKKYL
jgi:methionine synthase II (cobalamin-independent)